MLQDKYGRLIIIGVFVIIGIVLIMAPGFNSKKNSETNDQLNFTSMPKEVQNIGEVENPDKINQDFDSSNHVSQSYDSASAEEQMLDAWGMRKTPNDSSHQQIIPNENITPDDMKSKADEIARNIEDAKAKQAGQISQHSEQPQQPKPKSLNNLIKVNGKCFAPPKVSAAMTKEECDKTGVRFGIQACPKDDTITDGWAGAVRACGGVEKMPDLNDLMALAKIVYDNVRIKQLPPTSKAFGKYTTQDIGCDEFQINGLPYNTEIAKKYGLPEKGDFEIWGKPELNPKYGISLFFGNNSLTHNMCTNRAAQSSYSLCQVECE